MRRNRSIFYLTLGMAFLLSPFFSAKAVCPVCTVAVGAGIGLSRWLGIDDIITSLWIGALTVSLSMWTIDWLDKKQYDFFAKKFITYASYYLMVFLSLYWLGFLNHPLNKLWDIDKLLLGTVIGSVFFYLANLTNLYLKKTNNGKVYFPFQKVAIPIFVLSILSMTFFLITKN